MQELNQKIPDGLVKCEVCGEYRGKTKEKNLSNWRNLEKLISVSCLCEGILCPKCKKNKIHRPVSNSYFPEDNSVWHYPYFSGMRPCDECRNKKAAQKP
jgi:hypothetical protein